MNISVTEMADEMPMFIYSGLHCVYHTVHLLLPIKGKINCEMKIGIKD